MAKLLTNMERARIFLDKLEMEEGRIMTKPKTIITMVINLIKAIRKEERDRLFECVERDEQLRPHAPKLVQYLKAC